MGLVMAPEIKEPRAEHRDLLAARIVAEALEHRLRWCAGVRDCWGVSAIETHDCFTTSEYMAIDHFGITAPGESWKAVESGILEKDGAALVVRDVARLEKMVEDVRGAA